MNWFKVAEKFVKGVILGGLGTIVPNLPDIIGGSGSIKDGTIPALVVGVLSAVINYIKHRKD
jgi:hypothetical protein